MASETAGRPVSTHDIKIVGKLLLSLSEIFKIAGFRFMRSHHSITEILLNYKMVVISGPETH